MQIDLEEQIAKNENLSKLLENERAQYARTIREKQYDHRSKVNELNTQNRVEKQNIVRLEMEKQQLASQLTELKTDLDKIKANEKKVKSELTEEKLKNSKVLQEALALRNSSSSIGPQAGPFSGGGY